MRKRWITSLALSLGLLATGVRGGEDGWRVAPRAGTSSSSWETGKASPTSSTPPIRLDRSAAAGKSSSKGWDTPVTPAGITPAVQLGRPVAALGRPVPLTIHRLASGLKPVSFIGEDPDGGVAGRGLGSDRAIPRQMPVGPPPAGSPNQKFVGTSAQPNLGPAPIEPEPLPAPRQTMPEPGGPIPLAPGPITPTPMPAEILMPGQAPLSSGPVFPDGQLHPEFSTCEHCGDHLGGVCSDCDGGCCSGECCDCCCPSGHRFYVSAEYLLWWTKGSHLPPLLTTATAQEPADAAQGLPGRTGALGLPNTRLLLGNQDALTGPRSGGRLMAGFWLDEERLLGLEAGGFFLQTLTNTYSFSSDGSLPLYRPFLGADSGREGVQIVATNFPGQPPLTAGTFTAKITGIFWGAEANVRSCLLFGPDYFVDGLVGFRTLALNEDLSMQETPNLPLGGTFRGINFPMGTAFVVNDYFRTRNQFYGAQIGTVAEYRYGPWMVNVTGKIGVGATQQSVIINGSTLSSIPGMGSTSSPNGFLAGPFNSGHFARSVFSYVPEFGVNLGYKVTEHIRLFAGYNIIYWSNVVQPGNQINRTVNPNFLPGAPANPTPGAPQPTFVFNSSSYWAQGLTVGVEFRY